MALRIGPASFSGSGGAVKVGQARYSYPPGSHVQFYDDPATAWRVALVRVPHPGYAHPWTLHVVCERGEIHGIPAPLQMRAEREFFPSG